MPADSLKYPVIPQLLQETTFFRRNNPTTTATFFRVYCWSRRKGSYSSVLPSRILPPGCPLHHRWGHRSPARYVAAARSPRDSRPFFKISNINHTIFSPAGGQSRLRRLRPVFRGVEGARRLPGTHPRSNVARCGIPLLLVAVLRGGGIGVGFLRHPTSSFR